MSRRQKKKRSPVFVVSVAAHFVLGAVLAFIPQDKLREVVAIALNEAPEREKKAEPPKPEPHKDRPAPSPGQRARSAPVHADVAPATNTPQTAFTDIGLALDSNAEGGLAMNIVKPPPPPPKVVEAPPRPRVLVAVAREDVCTEELVKPRPLSMVRPSYTDEARRAHVEGRIRIEVFVNERGEVTDTRVLTGLGYGLDDVATNALRRLTFAPATRCQKPVAASLVIGMRFALGT